MFKPSLSLEADFKWSPIRSWPLAVYRAEKYIQHGGKNLLIVERCKDILSSEKSKYTEWLRNHASASRHVEAASASLSDAEITPVLPVQYDYKIDNSKYTPANPLFKWDHRKKEKSPRQHLIEEEQNRVKVIVRAYASGGAANGRQRMTLYATGYIQRTAKIIAYTSVTPAYTDLARQLQQEVLQETGDGVDLIQEAFLAYQYLYNAGLLLSPWYVWRYAWYAYDRVNTYIRSMRGIRRHESGGESLAMVDDTQSKHDRNLENIEHVGTLASVWEELKKRLPKRSEPEKLERIYHMMVDGYKEAEMAEIVGVSVRQIAKYKKLLRNIAAEMLASDRPSKFGYAGGRRGVI